MKQKDGVVSGVDGYHPKLPLSDEKYHRITT